MSVDIHFALNCVKGSFVTSKRVVPSLNVKMLCLCLRIPFSIGSGHLFLPIRDFTPLSGSAGLRSNFCNALLSVYFRGKLVIECVVNCELQNLHRLSVLLFSAGLLQTVHSHCNSVAVLHV